MYCIVKLLIVSIVLTFVILTHQTVVLASENLAFATMNFLHDHSLLLGVIGFLVILDSIFGHHGGPTRLA